MAKSSTKIQRRRHNMKKKTQAGRNRIRKKKTQAGRNRIRKKQTVPSTSPNSECRNWVNLPNDVTASILSRLSMFDILERAQKVCLTWRRICKDPLIWRTIDMKFHRHLRQQNEGNFTLTDDSTLNKKIKLYLNQFVNFNVHKMCHHAIDLSCGNLVDISIQNCGSDALLEHMANSSRGIRRLSIVFSAYITMKGLSEVASKIPLLEDLEISYTRESNRPFGRLEHEYLEVIGRSCPLLKSLRLNKHEETIFNMKSNGDAVAIARTMHGLQNLQLYGNKLNQQGLHAILEGCPSLESLDLRKCTHLHLGSQGWGRRAMDEGCLKACRLERFKGREGPLPINSCPSHEPCPYLEDLKTRCFEQIKLLRLPDDSTDDYEHLAIHTSVDRQYCELLKNVYI